MLVRETRRNKLQFCPIKTSGNIHIANIIFGTNTQPHRIINYAVKKTIDTHNFH